MLNYIKGDLFGHTSKRVAVLAHACNPHGSWGGGIAAQFAKRYPDACKRYEAVCKEKGPTLLGTSCVLPPEGRQNVYIACLFTSNFDNSPSDIVEYTRQALMDLAGQLSVLEDVERDKDGFVVVNMPKINSGIFNVPWKLTERALLEADQLSFNIYEV
ncbi:hypothetical protein FT663_04202 [Candidozyma haemuli var. vulneris]|nr:hypothetical protein FT662_04598 [[Candida] haemuloni var. vulneris]KAF3988031.1 hypothetical protein FT663_04202 [[Candida] haemuloni var. vulneris]